MAPFFLTLCVVITAADEVAATRLTAGAGPEAENGEPTDVGAALFDGSSWRHEPTPAQNVPVLVKLAEPFDLTRIDVVNATGGDEHSSTRSLRVEAAPGRSGPWAKILEATLKKGGATQHFTVKAPLTRYLRISLLANYGGMQRFALDELTAFGRRSKPRTQIDFTGAWDTNFGEVRLEQKGQKVTGCYGPPGTNAADFTISGSTQGPALTGTWRENKSELAGGVQTGALAFGLTAEGDFSGVFGAQLRGESMSRWLGTKKAKPTISCIPPEKEPDAAPREKRVSPVNKLDEELQAEGRVTLRGLLFRTGSDVIVSESTPVLEALAASLKAHPTVKCIIEGHTDDRGSPEVNQKLSERRAASVKAWLAKNGVAPARLSTKGFGQSYPTRSNETEAGRTANRRVEVAIVK